MKFRKTYGFAIVAGGVTLMLFTHHRLNANGFFVIQSKITEQLADLRSNTPSLAAFPVKSKEGGKIIGSKPPFKGKMWYGIMFNGSEGTLVVFWEGNSNACQIDKIELQTAAFDGRVIWQRNTN